MSYIEYINKEFVDILFSPFGGASAVVIALSIYLGNISSKRIISRELNKQEQELENVKTENNIRLEALKNEYTSSLEIQKLESTNNLEKLRNELKTDFLKFETYTSISKEKFQQLFDQRIAVYQGFLELKKVMDDAIIENADYLEFHDDNPQPFVDSVKKINEASRSNPLVMSNELANLSNELYQKSSLVLSNAKIAVFHESQNRIDENDPQHIIEAEEKVLRNMQKECSEVYIKWFEQLELDVSQIRSVLDISNNFLN